MKNALIILAGGSGKRLKKSNKTPKQFIKIGNQNIIEYFLSNLDKRIFDIIVIVINKKLVSKYTKDIKKEFLEHNIKFVNSGDTRQKSSKNGLTYLEKFKPKKVLIHDAARPLADNNLFKKIINNLDKNKSVIPFTKSNDLIKSENIKKYKNLKHIQTPQGFNFKLILNLHKDSKFEYHKDDSSLFDDKKIKIKYIQGNKINFKITYDEDLQLFKKLISTKKYGIGYDIHKINFNSNKKLTLCGVKINHRPLDGHSDADVGYHAICDSILGALGLKDIGHYFNNKNKKWKNANSKIFMIFCKKQLELKNYKLINLDVNFICESPKISKYAIQMRKNISEILKLNTKNISIKATTNEKISFIGKGEGIAAEAIVSIENE